jgi:hypothetical protein
MFAPSGLNTGLLVDAQHVISWPQRYTFPAAPVQINDTASPAGEISVAWKNPTAMAPGTQRILAKQRQSVVPLILATMPLAIASCRSSATDQRAKGRSRRDGSSQANALIATTTLGGKAGWSPAAWSIVETRQPLKTEPLTPLAGDLAWQAKLSCYPIVAEPPAREQYDLRPHDIAI